MAFTFSYNDYFKNNANAQIPSSSTVPTTSSTVPTTPVLYSQFVSPPTYTPPSLTTTPAPNPTPTPTPSTGYGAVTGQYGTTTPTSAGKGTGGSTITYSSGLGGDVTGGSEGGDLGIQRVSEVLTGSNGVTGEYSIGGVIGSTTRKAWERIKELLDGDGTPTIEISEDGYLVIDGVKTEYQVPGKNGADGNGGGDETGGGNGNNDDLRKYYEFLYNTGLANAEQAKQQALLNAQTQYKEFINPYGTVANQQAALGLQNGGYSEYLQGQAYQGMLNTQNQARSDYSKTQQSLYSDYMGNMAKYNQEQQNKADAVAAAKAELLNNIGNYTSEEALGAALDALGITDAAERQVYIDAWTKQKDKADTETKVDNTLTMDALISGNSEYDPSLDNIQAVGERLGLSQEEIDSWKQKFERKQYAESPSTGWSANDWQSFFNKGLDENGEGEAWFDSLSEDEQKAANELYSSVIAKANIDSKTGETTFFIENGKPYRDDAAQEEYKSLMADEHLTGTLKDAIKKEYESRYLKGLEKETFDVVEEVKKLNPNIRVFETAKVVDPSSKSYTSKDFGKFNDTGKAGSGQESLISAIVEAANSGKITDGEIVLVNYGINEGKTEAFMYVKGKFVEVDNIDQIDNPKFYIPDGYEISTSISDAYVDYTSGVAYPKKVYHTIYKKKK